MTCIAEDYCFSALDDLHFADIESFGSCGNCYREKMDLSNDDFLQILPQTPIVCQMSASLPAMMSVFTRAEVARLSQQHCSTYCHDSDCGTEEVS